MDRKIVVEVNGSYLRKDNKIAGVQGEGNSTYLNLIFDEGWNGLAKKITFWNSKGMNPVEITLTTDHLTNISTSLFDYTVSIPPEPLEFDGEMEYVIDGYKDGVRVRSLADKMVVKYAPTANNAGSPADPTPTQAEQLQKQIDTMLGDMQAERIKAETAASTSQQAAETSVLAKGSAESAAQTATTKAGEASDSASAAKTSEENAKQSETNAKASEESAANYAQTAANKALEAKQALEETITAKNSAESAKTVAETARDESVSAKDESVSAKEYSVAAKEAAETAKNNAEQAMEDAVAAKTAAISAQSSAETAQSGAEQAKSEAAAARDAAVTAKNEAESAKESAETAKAGAEQARTSVVEAKTAAETARDEAITAKTAAETAKNEAVSAKESAVTAKTEAIIAKTETEQAKEDAIAAKTAAETARDQAQEIAGGDYATKTELTQGLSTKLSASDIINNLTSGGTSVPLSAEQGKVLKGLIDKLNGNSSEVGSVAYQIAQIVAGADTRYDTLKEISDWIISDTTGAAKMASDILALQNEKANKSTISISTMSASGWSGSVYSFESTYPVATYDIEVALDSTATSEQAEAFNGAQIVGSATSNVVKAYGIVPTVDIPICIKAVMK